MPAEEKLDVRPRAASPLSLSVFLLDPGKMGGFSELFVRFGDVRMDGWVGGCYARHDTMAENREAFGV